MSFFTLVNAIKCIQKDIRQLQNAVYSTDFHTRDRNAEIKVDNDSKTIDSNTLTIKDEKKDSDEVNILKTLANLLIPATPICLISYLNNPVDTSAAGQLIIKDFLYWVCVL